jgi:hypothetical protein
MRSLFRSFAHGEITPELIGRPELVAYQTGVQLAYNYEVLPHGPLRSAPGFKYVLETKDSSKTSRIHSFIYSNDQVYQIEIGDLYMRFHTADGTVLESTKNITGVTNASPGVLHIASHGYSVDDWIYLAGIGGTTELNGRFVKVNAVVDADHISAKGLDDAAIDTTSYGVYTSGGTAAKVYEISTPYAEADIFDLDMSTQSRDVMTITHPSYAARELTRLTATTFDLSAISFGSGGHFNILSDYVFSNGNVTAGWSTYGGAATWLSTNSFSVGGDATSIFSAGRQIRINSNLGGVQLWWHGTVGTGTYNGSTTTITLAGLTYNYDIYGLPLGILYNITQVDVADAGTFTEYDYLLTAIDANGHESGDHIIGSCWGDLPTGTNSNDLSWNAVSSAIRFNVYKLSNGDVWGFIGVSDGTTFTDNYIAADTSVSPPTKSYDISSSGNYPICAGYYDGRRAFGGSANSPGRYVMTQSGTESSLSYALPIKDSDSIEGRLVATQAQEIRQIIPFNDLVFLASGGPWRISPANSDVLTPASVSPRLQPGFGTSKIEAFVTDQSILYVEDGNGRPLEMKPGGYDSNGRVTYEVHDLGLFAKHLFSGYTFADAAYGNKSYPYYWMVRSDGTLLGCCYVPAQEVVGWFQRATDGGYFESVTTTPKGTESELFAIVRRTIGGRTVRYVEKRENPNGITALADWFGVDSGLTYSGAATTTVSNLWHLEGETGIVALADGATYTDLTVTNGQITIDEAATTIHVGKPIRCDTKLMPLVIQVDQAIGRGLYKDISKAYIQVVNATDISAGPSFDLLQQYPTRTTEPWGSPPSLLNTEIEITVDADWTVDGTIYLRHTDPTPCTIVGVALDYEPSGQ